jgi:hypothetical protein
MQFPSTTDILAFYGAVLSSLAITWNIYRDLTERGKLHVHCYLGKIAGPNLPPDDKDYLVYSVTNTGRKPIQVTHIGGARRGKDFIVIPRSLPKMLSPGEYVLEYTSDLSVLDTSLRFLAAWDSLNRVHKVKRSVTRDLVRARL